MSNPATRHFIIAREGQSVIVREILDGSDVTFSRIGAWSLAQRMAKPAKAAKDSRAKQPNSIVFIDMHGVRTEVQSIEATQDAYEAELRGEKSAPTAPVARPIIAEDAPVNGRVATDKQYAFITTLCNERDLPVPAREATVNASTLITTLLTKPKVAKPVPSTNVSEGRYAVETEAGHLAFYHLQMPTEGKWKGFSFLKVMASDEEHAVKGGAKATIMAKIAKDPQAAMIRYGQEIGKCGHCNRTLTDEASRAAGIGPVCAEKM